MKKLINAPDDFVAEQLEGMAAAHPELRVHIRPHYIARSGAPVARKVAVISGGGSGHEPMHGGFVGVGMLAGACPGEVFTSPTPDQMYECGKAVDGGAGILFLVKNYTGDVFSFETAVEMLHAEGIAVQMILIDDDVAVKDSLYTAGRRGVGTTVIAEKIVGAAAEEGCGLDQCAALARRISQNGRSMGMALTSCVTPAKGAPIFKLGQEEMEIGIGIHGEPGRRRTSLAQADTVTELLTNEILDDGPYSRAVRQWDRQTGEWVEMTLANEPLRLGDSVIALVNSMGGTPLSELYVVYRHLTKLCAQRDITVARNLIGSYITSLEMQGCSITLVRADAEMLRLWDAPVKTPALRWGV
jgi:dihydroxyacetone kinase-like protein